MIGLALLLSGYPVCVATEAADGTFPDVACYDTQTVRAWRFCSDNEADPPGGLFTDYAEPLRFVGYEECGEHWCPVVSGRAHRKEVARTEAGVAYATGLVVKSGEMRDDFEPLDRFSNSSCTFAVVL